MRRAADTHIKEEAAHKRKEEDIPDFELTQEARRASRTSLRFAKEGPTIMGDGKGRPDDEDGEDKKEKPKMKPGPVKVGTSKSSGKGKNSFGISYGQGINGFCGAYGRGRWICCSWHLLAPGLLYIFNDRTREGRSSGVFFFFLYYVTDLSGSHHSLLCTTEHTFRFVLYIPKFSHTCCRKWISLHPSLLLNTGKKADPTHCFFCSRSVKDETNPKVVKGQAICMSCRMEGKKLA